jgi:hypothetical protein
MARKLQSGAALYIQQDHIQLLTLHVYHHLVTPHNLLELALAAVRHVTWLRLEVVNCGELVDGFSAEEDIDKQLNILVRGEFAI